MEDPKSPAVDRDDPLPPAALGHAVKVIRTGLGLDRKDLAREAGLSYSYLAEIENGRKPASASAQQALARALGLSPSELLAAAEEWAVRLRGAEVETPGWLEEANARPIELRLPRSSPAPSSGARARQERWFRASSLRPWSSSSGSRAPAPPAAAGLAEDDADALEEELALLRKLLATLSPGDRERVLDLARRLARR